MLLADPQSHFMIAGLYSNATAVLLDSSAAGVPSWCCLQLQQQRSKRQPLEGLQNLGEKNNAMIVAMI